MKGICGKLLEVDLTSGKTKDTPISDEMVEKYLGGRGLGARLLFDLLPAKDRPSFSGKRAYLFDRAPHRIDGDRFVQICRGDQVPSHPGMVRQLFQRKDIARA